MSSVAMSSDLLAVGRSLEPARKTFWVIAQNLTWAFAYNLLMIPLAAAGRVSPLTAAAAMAGSSVTVIANALRLCRFEFAKKAPDESDATTVAHVSSRVVAPAEVEPPATLVDPPAAAVHAPAPSYVVPAEAVPLPRFVREESSRFLNFLTGLWARSWEY